jgi:uncharacterized protein (TIGR02145 family)
MLTVIRKRRAFLGVTVAAAVTVTVLCCGCADNGIGGGGVVDGGTLYYAGQDYRTVKIGGKRWMAENLNYAVDSSWCYGNDPSNCEKYGRLYQWASAMDIDASYNNSVWRGSDVKHRGICPSGWHLPSRQEWNNLVSAVGSPAGTKLKSTSGWSSNGNGTDNFGFSALPGGYRDYSDGYFGNAGNYGNWWTATEYGSSYAYYRDMYYNHGSVLEDDNYKDLGFSVRCVEDVRQ